LYLRRGARGKSVSGGQSHSTAQSGDQ